MVIIKISGLRCQSFSLFLFLSLSCRLFSSSRFLFFSFTSIECSFLSSPVCIVLVLLIYRDGGYTWGACCLNCGYEPREDHAALLDAMGHYVIVDGDVPNLNKSYYNDIFWSTFSFHDIAAVARNCKVTVPASGIIGLRCSPGDEACVSSGAASSRDEPVTATTTTSSDSGLSTTTIIIVVLVVLAAAGAGYY